MTTYLGMNFDSEEMALERVHNIYKDKEFNVELPDDSALVVMPNMFWTRVCVHIVFSSAFPHFLYLCIYRQKTTNCCFLSSFF
jgi:hypothetical protein